ncbi:MAG: CoA transferase [Kofleriaceae bacterium]|nr:CoA transferase [Kofleriaceae bacterium]
MADALRGVRVLDLSRLLPGPFLTMILADLGADVVKIEDPRIGDYLRAFPPVKGGVAGRYLAVNRGKRSLALDLKTSAGREVFLQMLAKADVVVESFRPGVLSKLGIGWDVISQTNPRAILCSISGYGQTGPYRERAGHDLNYIALAGVLAMGGARNGAPVMPGVQIADLAGGALWSATGILAALFARERSGRGTLLDISMTEGALTLLTAELGNLDCGVHPSRSTELLNGAAAAYGVYRTLDDRYVAVGALEPKFWVALQAALGRTPNIAELAGNAQQQEATRLALAEIFATKSLAEWTVILAAHDCCVEPIIEPDELPAHPLHQARAVFFSIDGGEGVGPISQVRTPLGTPVHASAPPRLGQHSAEVLRDYGVSMEL